jgi:hypothetical protein
VAPVDKGDLGLIPGFTWDIIRDMLAGMEVTTAGVSPLSGVAAEAVVGVTAGTLVVTEGATTTTGFMAMEAMDVATLVAKVAMAISVAKVLVVITRRRRHITLPTLDSRSCPHQGGRLQ